MKDPMRPPTKYVRSELAKAYNRVARLKLKLRKQRKAIEATEAELRSAQKVAHAILDDAVPEPELATLELHDDEPEPGGEG